MELRLKKIDSNGDPLVTIKKAINWDIFRSRIDAVRSKDRKSLAGRRPFDAVLMFKILVLQSLYNLSDDAIESQILDRLSFMRFLDLSLGDRVPDAKTIWLFREQLTKAGAVEELFETFNQFLIDQGMKAKKGQIVDASIVQVPIQRNLKEENEQIKKGDMPKSWSENKQRQKDVNARWTRKGGKSFYGYKNHIGVDVQHKLIRTFEVTEACVHDSKVLEQLLDETNSSRSVWADSIYRNKNTVKRMAELGYREKFQRKGCHHRKLTNKERQGNRTRSRTRIRVEHVFGSQTQLAGSTIIRAIGLVRAKVTIGLRNLAYNIYRYSTVLCPT